MDKTTLVEALRELEAANADNLPRLMGEHVYPRVERMENALNEIVSICRQTKRGDVEVCYGQQQRIIELATNALSAVPDAGGCGASSR